MLSIQVSDQSIRFFLGKNDRYVLRVSSAFDALNVRQFDFQNLPVKKQQRIESLVLGGRCDPIVDRQVSEKTAHGLGIQVSWVSLSVKENEPFDPIPVTVFGPNAKMPQPSHIPDLFKQFSLRHDDA
jgi:hypothetical protein